MKRNFWNKIILAGLLLIPTCLLAMQQLPTGTTSRVFERWEWNNATLASVAAQIASVSGVDIIVDNEIAESRIRLSLRNRTWQDVLRVLCQVNGLNYSVSGSHIFITTAAAAAQVVTDSIELLIRDAETQQRLERIENLEILTVRLRNTTADQMESAVRSVLSGRGTASAIQHTNSLVIRELPRNLPTVMEFIDEMDREMLQISISAKIVEISSNMRNEMGIQWSFFGSGGDVSHLQPSGSSILSNALQRATYGVLDPIGFNIAMEYLFTRGNSEIIAEPQITTIENREARIFMGSQIPVSHLDVAGNSVIEMINAGTELIVTPTVTGQGDIKMELNPTRKSFEISERGPIIHEQGARTNVVVRDGETIVIAGLTSDDRQNSYGGIPILMDIPIIGRLFRRSMRSNDKRDLVIFVTPNIIKRTRLDLLTNEPPAQTNAPTHFAPEPLYIEWSQQ